MKDNIVFIVGFENINPPPPQHSTPSKPLNCIYILYQLKQTLLKLLINLEYENDNLWMRMCRVWSYEYKLKTHPTIIKVSH